MDIRSALNVKEDAPEFFSVEGLESAAKWSAGGFTLLAGLLTFFGVKEGALDRILRVDPARALFIFVLVGIGLLCALLAPAMRAGIQVSLYAVLAPVAVLAGLATYFARNDATSPDVSAIGVFGLILLVVAWLLLGRVTLSIVAAALVVGVAATSMGLYSAATVAVSAKRFPERPRLVATVEESDGRQVVSVTAKVGKVDNAALVVIVSGSDEVPTKNAPGTELGQSVLYPDATGDVDATVRFPVVPARWPWLAVSYCTDAGCRERSGAVVTLRGRPDDQPARVGAAIAPDDPGVLAVAVTGANLAPTTTVDVTVTRTRGGKAQTYVARLVGDDKGTAAWLPKVTGVKPGDTVTVTYVVCQPDCEAAVEIARYVA